MIRVLMFVFIDGGSMMCIDNNIQITCSISVRA